MKQKKLPLLVAASANSVLLERDQVPATLPAKRGRKFGPPRCVIQLRVRNQGRVVSYYSRTVHRQPSQVMKMLQEMFGDEHTSGKTP